jgi:hypothetical protein
VSPTTPEYLRWSESPIIFDRMDHLNSIPKRGWFPLIVDLLVSMTRLTKALMDGGSSLNLMYLDTFDGLGLTRDQLQSSLHPFDGVVPGKQSVLLGWVTMWVTFGNVSNCRTETYQAFPHHLRTTMLHLVHGHPQLRIPQAQDTRARWDHQRGGQASAGAELQVGHHRAERRCGRHS